MAKKIFDIKHPKKVSKTEEKNQVKNGVAKKHRRGDVSHQKMHFPLKGLLAGCGILVLILVGFLYFKLQKASIEIWPKTEILSFEEQVSADASVDKVDIASKVIPLQYFEEEKDLWQEFPATGNASNDGKAEGTITIYNSYSPATVVTLKTGTHFLSDSGKYFIILQKVVIPAAKKQNNKTVPGSISVKVQAVEAGEDYNIKASKFSVPGLSGTSYYYSVYAESSKAMTGGFSSEVKKVTENDIQNAKEILTKKLLNDTQEALKSRIGADYVLLENAILTEITESSSAVKAGAVVNKFSYQAKVKASALAFKKSDLENLIRGHIELNISDQKTFLEDSLGTEYTPVTIDMKDKKMVLDLDFSIRTYKEVDGDDLISLFREKSAVQIEEAINSRMGDQVFKSEVNLWPFWTTKAPRDKNKIKIDLRFD